jgi:hypothetical protein
MLWKFLSKANQRGHGHSLIKTGSARAADEPLAQLLPERLLAAAPLEIFQISQQLEGHIDR